MYNFSEKRVKKNLSALFHDKADIHLSHPFGDISGPSEFYNKSLKFLFESMPDLERRDYIVIAGKTEKDLEWVGCAGFYTGTFFKPFLDIPPTGHIAHMRFHEFYRFEGDKVVEVQALWDIPELMMQSGSCLWLQHLEENGVFLALQQWMGFQICLMILLKATFQWSIF